MSLKLTATNLTALLSHTLVTRNIDVQELSNLSGINIETIESLCSGDLELPVSSLNRILEELNLSLFVDGPNRYDDSADPDDQALIEFAAPGLSNGNS